MAQIGKRLSALPPISELLGNEIFYVVDPDTGLSRRASINLITEVVEDGLNINNGDGFGTIASQDANDVEISGGTIDNTEIGGTIAADGTFDNLTVTGTMAIPAGSITSTMLAGNIPNSKLTNNTITVNTTGGLVGGGVISLGGNITLDIEEVDGGLF